MNKILVIVLLTTLSCLAISCTKEYHPYAGTFYDEQGVKYELRTDSTTLITYSDSVTYESTWMISKSEDGKYEYANIEFAGNQYYFYLMDEVLYRSERELRHRIHGSKVKYIE